MTSPEGKWIIKTAEVISKDCMAEALTHLKLQRGSNYGSHDPICTYFTEIGRIYYWYLSYDLES